MANYINIESLILDALTDAPVGFEINNKRYSIYPPTLGKKLLIDQLKRKLSINPECSKALQEMKNDLAAVKNNTAGLARR